MGEPGLKGSVATGSSKLARDKGGGEECEGVQAEGKNMCQGERTLCYHRKMEFIRGGTDVGLGVEAGKAEKRSHRRLVSHTLLSGPDPVISFSVVRKWGVSALQASQSVGC